MVACPHRTRGANRELVAAGVSLWKGVALEFLTYVWFHFVGPEPSYIRGCASCGTVSTALMCSGGASMYDVFVSYARSDAAHARLLASYLAEHGLSVWWDPFISTGENFIRAVSSALQSSRCVVVLWSPRSVESRWVPAEADDGLRRGVLIPVLIERTPLPPPFNIIQTIDLVVTDERAVRERLGAVLTAVQMKLQSPSKPSEHPASASVAEFEDPEFREGLQLFRDGYFVPALGRFRAVIKRYPRSSEARYFLVLCALAGRRPKLLRPERLAEIETQLREALVSATGDATHIRYLWAIVRYDYYTLNGFREPTPTTDELLAASRSLDRLRVKELTSALAAPGNPIWETVCQ